MDDSNINTLMVGLIGYVPLQFFKFTDLPLQFVYFKLCHHNFTTLQNVPLLTSLLCFLKFKGQNTLSSSSSHRLSSSYLPLSLSLSVTRADPPRPPWAGVPPSRAAARPGLAADELEVLSGAERKAADTAARRPLSLLPWHPATALLLQLLRVVDGGQPQHASARCHLPPPEPDAEMGN